MRENLQCDVVVVGAGPAGTLVASELAKEGKSIIQIQSPSKSSCRPFEILAPSTRNLLASNGLTEPADCSSKCRGVISVWSSQEPLFHDYELMNGIAGLTIDRNAFHKSLSMNTHNAGVRILNKEDWQYCHIDQLGMDEIRCQLLGGEIKISANFLIDATGRQSNFWAHNKMEREYINNQIALLIPFLPNKWNDCLILEAVAYGWFYIPPVIDGQTHLVFMTDADLFPRGKEERRSWLARCFESANFVKGISSSVPNFSQIKGVDSRFSRLHKPLNGNIAFVGDIALALDPLSGTGTWTALSAAQKLKSCLTGNGNLEEDYVNWYDEIYIQEKRFYKKNYAEAAARFPGSTFWERRV